MTTQTTTQAAAEQEAAEANALLAALEERVRDGDEGVTPQQLAEQRELGLFAHLRAEAAHRKAERAATEATDRQRRALVDQALALVETKADADQVGRAYDRALAALADLVAAVEAHDQAVSEAGRLLRDAECGPINEYVQVDHGEYVTREARPAAATRTAPRVDVSPGSTAFTFGKGIHVPVGTGQVLAVLFSKVAAGDTGKMPSGEPALTAAPITQHVDRHGEQVRRFLARSEGGEAA
ncbi:MULTISPECIES: hypothetical protein [Streptomyces]|uniref:Uncharacterized protein n=1 Tax=Streptomyces venezuelae TaxID=54571 RepID=A0A5P2ASC2_STRVZ|nr:hypothetical protein [Streptomyces venezuelae]QES20458.1 hypothetical protein DEJ46_16120 [Streptomyces venezuelae]